MVCNYLSPDYNENVSFLFTMRFAASLDRNGNKRIRARVHSIFHLGQVNAFHTHVYCVERRNRRKKKHTQNHMKYVWLLWMHSAHTMSGIAFVFGHFSGWLCLFVSEYPYLCITYPMSGLAPARSWLFVQVSVTLLSVTFTTRGVPGIDGNVLGSGVRCRFTLPLFST